MGYSMRNAGRAFASAERRVFGKKIGVIVRLFGCRHGNLSRPFSKGRLSYRSCLSCGARKKFDTETLVTHGGFYYPPEISLK
ncbi:MAG: hypothetical protein DWQ47_10345 [Acidobacteria bacterium]|nr:MAG: hypothetical protein DWQ32_12760 [Acidobacteriota bacterium]REJ97984.1 MAG: hypothetical protein DWQ38_15560 [Acidobacteriota bacterium]REK16727.1 MAG: hypothetical protein DWQ43_00605 [Acidobacteriota bacterium]REK42638.1 MAG: hypothetical protein DWQ47_10345 [Acidobacteriota bacterium]